ncbi:MAG: low specificity L-threonine aldolase [Lautropia sp.]
MDWLRSDTVAGVSDRILDAIRACNAAFEPPYGEDSLSRQLDDRYSALFGTPVRVFPVVSGTAANALALASIAGPFELIACHDEAHAYAAETGATEFFSGGARFLRLPGEHGRIDPETAAPALAAARAAGGKTFRLAAITITQLTEVGTLYPVACARTIGELARRHGLHFHVDGARFANAVAALGVEPADLTWRLGADVMSFGATKNGTMCADAVIFFKPELADDFLRRRKRSGHDLSKARFLAAQLLAYLDGGHWLENAHRANRMAGELERVIRSAPDIELLQPVEGNMLFVAMSEARHAALAAAGITVRKVGARGDGRSVIRMVTSYRTGHDEIERFARAADAARPA